MACQMPLKFALPSAVREIAAACACPNAGSARPTMIVATRDAAIRNDALTNRMFISCDSRLRFPLGLRVVGSAGTGSPEEQLAPIRIGEVPSIGPQAPILGLIPGDEDHG